MTRPGYVTLLVFVLLVGCVAAPRSTTGSASLTTVTTIKKTVGAVEQIALREHWLVWTYRKSPTAETDPVKYGMVVYDLDQHRVIFAIDQPSYPVWLSSDRLLFLQIWDVRQGQPANEAGYTFYQLNLKTLEKTLVLDDVPQGLASNGAEAWWFLSDTCQPLTPCPDQPESVCAFSDRVLYSYDFSTQRLRMEKSYETDAYLAGVTDTLIVVGHGSGSCSIKGYSGPLVALDPEKGSEWEIAPMSALPGEFIGLRALNSRRILLQRGFDGMMIVDVPDRGHLQMKADTTWGTAFGFAGANVLLYAPTVSPDDLTQNRGLVAYDIETGRTQNLASEDQSVVMAVGDAHRVAWVTTEGWLQVSDLDLQPGERRDLIETPEPGLLVPTMTSSAAYP